jgi:hypothetical protein
MTRPELVTDQATTLRKALAVLDPRDGGTLPDDLRQELMRLAVTTYATAWQERRAAPLANPSDITATEAVVAASALIRALNIELFELAMWQTQAG